MIRCEVLRRNENIFDIVRNISLLRLHKYNKCHLRGENENIFRKHSTKRNPDTLLEIYSTNSLMHAVGCQKDSNIKENIAEMKAFVLLNSIKNC